MAQAPRGSRGAGSPAILHVHEPSRHTVVDKPVLGGGFQMDDEAPRVRGEFVHICIRAFPEPFETSGRFFPRKSFLVQA